MRLGVFGGTFDPVHYGHLLLAEQCREQCRLDQVWFVPAGQPPHKSSRIISPGKDRAAMLDLATAGMPQFAVSHIELDRPGRSFTVETLEQLRSDQPEWELFLLIGVDSLVDLPNWREPARIVEMAVIVAVNRGDRPLPDVEGVEQRLGNVPAGRIQCVTMPGVDISASDIRQRVREGRSIRFMTPRAVEMYIREHKLYVVD